ncbi:MAG TPA: tryptophan--tRNA ligase [Candidatus Fraserbacteria bacterium]|nr:tryptophan--tRNA ligase [Candidatus Fraserbacteria bacterium]
MTQAKIRVTSGIKPSGELHLGNYFGAISNWLALQEQYDCIYFIVDYHALTERWEPEQLKRRTFQMALDLLACGLDPQRAVLFVQSHLPQHTELCWILNNLAGFGDLLRMTQFKDKREQAEAQEGFVSAGLFDYPVLQAADILLYHGERVPVGEDQLQHLELTRRIARRFNGRFGEYFPEPEALTSEAPRIMSLADPTKKMSKSYGDKHVIRLSEPEESIRQKIKTAVTDVGPAGQAMSPGVQNLFLLLKLSAPVAVYEQFESEYKKGSLKYEPLKRALFENLLEKLRPIRERRAQFSEGQVRAVLQEGAERAGQIAGQTLCEVKKRIGVG